MTAPSVVAYKLDTIVMTSPSVTFSAISEKNLQNQIESFAEGPAGHPSPMFAAVKTVKPMTTFTTPELDKVAANIPVWGVAPGVTVYQKLSTSVAPASRASTSNRKFVYASAIAYWQSINLPDRDIGTAQLTLCSIYNGSAEPVVPTASVALAGTLAATKYFCAGPIWLVDDAVSPVTTNLLNIMSIQIDSGAQFRSDGDCSSIYDTYGEVTIKECVVTIKTRVPMNVTTWPIGGTAITAFRFFARAFKSGGSRIADATASHIKFAGTSGGTSAIALLIPENTMASGQELYADTFKLVCVSPDGTTPPIVMTNAVAIE